MTTAYNINNANLMNYYPLDTDYLDYASGVGVSNATTSNVNISTSTTKLQSGSLLLPGSTSQLFKLPTIQFASGGLTIAMWMKGNSIPNGYQRMIEFAANYNSPTQYLAIAFITAGVPLVGIGTPSIGTNANTNMNYTITDLNWHHYAFAFQSTGVLNFYVDGNLITGVSYTSYPPLVAFPSSFIGRLMDTLIVTRINSYCSIEPSLLLKYPI